MLEAHEFFLVYHGKGYNKTDISTMHLDELFRASRKLEEQLKAEQLRHQEMEAKQAASRRRR